MEAKCDGDFTTFIHIICWSPAGWERVPEIVAAEANGSKVAFSRSGVPVVAMLR